MDHTAPAPAPARIRPGQVWLSPKGTEWTVDRRRSRASGLVENLLVSSGGARKWLSESDVREQFTPAP